MQQALNLMADVGNVSATTLKFMANVSNVSPKSLEVCCLCW